MYTFLIFMAGASIAVLMMVCVVGVIIWVTLDDLDQVVEEEGYRPSILER